MSFLAEVLSVAEKVDLNEINNKVPDLTSAAESIKSQTIQYIENVYVKHNDKPKGNEDLIKKALGVQDELINLKNNANVFSKKELTKTNQELRKNVEQLEYVSGALEVALILLQVNKLVLESSKYREERMYLKCMELVQELERYAASMPEGDDIEIVNELKRHCVTEKLNIKCACLDVFETNVHLSQENKLTELKIAKHSSEFEEVLQALFIIEEAVIQLHTLAKALWDHVFVPVVDYATNVNVSEDSEYFILTVKIENDSKKLPYTAVFTNIKTVLDFLVQHFTITLDQRVTTLSYIGSDIRDNLSELIIKHCLQDTIPSNSEELQKYKVVIEDTKNLEMLLRESKIFANDTTSILEYASNVDIHFIDKKCSEYLQTAKSIMKKDLHTIIEVGKPYNPESALESSNHFPQCFVSKNVKELLELAESILKKSMTSSEACASRLFGTVRNIFTTYSSLVPDYHKKLLQTIPQQVALFHNNCKYMAFILQLWNEQYCLKLASVFTDCDFNNEILILELVASEHFSVYIEGQVQQVKDIMKDAGLGGPTVEKLKPVTEKCVRQCLRQQELLKTVWGKVLPYKLYNKTLGMLFNTLCVILIDSVVKYEDISSDSAEQFVEIVKLLLTRGPKLFTDPKEVSLFVTSWHKLNELQFVLGASLVDINDRWAEGKGPLALHFAPKDLKQLIRALFQNTDRRAAVLAKIQE